MRPPNQLRNQADLRSILFVRGYIIVSEYLPFSSWLRRATSTNILKRSKRKEQVHYLQEIQDLSFRVFDEIGGSFLASATLGDGTTLEKEATSLEQLLAKFPGFNSGQVGRVTRIKVVNGSHIVHGDTLLSLIQFNHGARGIDVSHCTLWHLALDRDTIRASRNGFFRVHGYDPAWWAVSSTRGLTLLASMRITRSSLDRTLLALISQVLIWKARILQTRYSRRPTSTKRNLPRVHSMEPTYVTQG